MSVEVNLVAEPIGHIGPEPTEAVMYQAYMTVSGDATGGTATLSGFFVDRKLDFLWLPLRFMIEGLASSTVAVAVDQQYYRAPSLLPWGVNLPSDGDGQVTASNLDSLLKALRYALLVPRAVASMSVRALWINTNLTEYKLAVDMIRLPRNSREAIDRLLS